MTGIMETKQQAIRKMEYRVAAAAGVPTPARADFLKWYRKTLDYRLAVMIALTKRIFKK